MAALRRPGVRPEPGRPHERSAADRIGGAPRAPDDWVLLGEFGRPHGLDGSLRLKSHTADPLAIAGYGPLLALGGRRFVIEKARQAAGDQPDLLVVQVEGIRTRDAAEPLNRLALHIERARLGEPEEDEFYLADLVGLRAEAPDGNVIGRVVDIPNYGGGELLEIAPETGGPTFLAPFTRAFVPIVDIGGQRIVVDLPADEAEDTGQSADPASEDRIG